MTLSLHAAAHPAAYVTFGVTATVVAAFLYPFFWWWYIPTLHLSALFGWATGLAAVCQVSLGWIPDKPGILSRIHNYIAFVAGTLIIALSIMLMQSSHVLTAIRIGIAAYLTLAAILIYLYFRVQAIRQHSLIGQVIFYWGFFTLLLAAGYIGQ